MLAIVKTKSKIKLLYVHGTLTGSHSLIKSRYIYIKKYVSLYIKSINILLVILTPFTKMAKFPKHNDIAYTSNLIGTSDEVILLPDTIYTIVLNAF